MTALSNLLLSHPEAARQSRNEEARTKPTVVVGDDGEWIWTQRPTPAQDDAWIAKCHRERDAALSCAKRLSKIAAGYANGAATDTNPERAARWITEARRLRDRAWSHLGMARRNNV